MHIRRLDEGRQNQSNVATPELLRRLDVRQVMAEPPVRLGQLDPASTPRKSDIDTVTMEPVLFPSNHNHYSGPLRNATS
jgi:hypothetical protein